MSMHEVCRSVAKGMKTGDITQKAGESVKAVEQALALIHKADVSDPRVKVREYKLGGQKMLVVRGTEVEKESIMLFNFCPEGRDDSGIEIPTSWSTINIAPKFFDSIRIQEGLAPLRRLHSSR